MGEIKKCCVDCKYLDGSPDFSYKCDKHNISVTCNWDVINKLCCSDFSHKSQKVKGWIGIYKHVYDNGSRGATDMYLTKQEAADQLRHPEKAIFIEVEVEI